MNTDHVFINVNVEQVNNILVSYAGPNQAVKANKKLPANTPAGSYIV